jgi:hypothetical protein
MAPAREVQSGRSKYLHHPLGLVSPSTTWHDRGGRNRLQAAQSRPLFGRSRYSASRCDIFFWADAAELTAPAIAPESTARIKVRRSTQPLSNRVADVTVAQIAAARAVLDVIGLDLGKAVGLGQRSVLVEIVEPHRIFGEDRSLHRAVG